MCCGIVLIQRLKIQALKLKLDMFPGSARAKDVCGTDISCRVEQFYFHTCLVISVDVVRNLKMYEDIYILYMMLTDDCLLLPGSSFLRGAFSAMKFIVSIQFAKCLFGIHGHLHCQHQGFSVHPSFFIGGL